MRILAIDTGGECCSIALQIDGKAVAEKIIPTQRDQAKMLAPLTAELLAAHHLKTQDIDRFGIATGPGSFTGLRVGLAFVRGLALANAKPAIGIDHFKIIAHACAPAPHPILIIRESKRADLFCAWLNADHQLGDYFLSPAQQLIDTLPHNCMITGNGAAQLTQLHPALETKLLHISDIDIIHSLATLTAKAEHTTATAPQPLYLREADVTPPKSKSCVA